MASKYSYAVFLALIVAYAAVSKWLYDKVYQSTKGQPIIDEVFHLDQGLAYCRGNLTYWNPKITTLPGLYLISTIISNTVLDCDLYSLRSVSFIASLVNLFLLRRILGHYQGVTDLRTDLQAFTLAILPPMYFFAFVFYTDILSITFVLLVADLSVRNANSAYIILASVMAIVTRQTNIVWICLHLGVRLMDVFLKSPQFKKLKNSKRTRLAPAPQKLRNSAIPANAHVFTVADFFKAVRYHTHTKLRFFSECVLHGFGDVFPYLFIMFAFIAFLAINGSITVGDKQAHAAALHIPQLFYFSLFYGVFGASFLIRSANETLAFLTKHKFVFVITVMITIIIIQLNTIVHPYLLADNRHFTFYIWNRFYGRYAFAKYFCSPLYIVLLTSLCINFKKVCISYWLPLVPCLFAAMALQQMIEVRYFLLPYIFVRVRFERPSWLEVIFELVLYACVNAAAFQVFFTKEIYWDDIEGVQRLIW